MKSNYLIEPGTVSVITFIDKAINTGYSAFERIKTKNLKSISIFGSRANK